MTPRGRERTSALIGVAASAFLAVMLNVLAARHATRWDWTAGRRFTLSEGTTATLRDLSDPVDMWVLLGGADPLRDGVRQLLATYAAASTRLDVHWVDPDRDALGFHEIEKRFGVEAGRAPDGRLVSDAVAVVASGSRSWFITAASLLEVEAGDVARVRPRHERAFTEAIRQVTSGEKVKVCFTTGHGELAADGLRALIEKDNYAPTTVETAAPDAQAPFAGCGLAVIAGARAPFTPDEESRLRAYLLGGGRALIVAGPAPSGDGFASTGLASTLAGFGIALDEDVVVEPDPAHVLPESHGAAFTVEPREHPVTAALVKRSADAPPRVIVEFARSMRQVAAPGAVAAASLLVTSDSAFGLRTVSGAGGFRAIPPRGAGDVPGPLVVAMASARKDEGGEGRVVVLGAASTIDDHAFTAPYPVRGAAFVAGGAVAWLAARAQVLDVPERPAVTAGIRISEGARAEVRRYVLFFMPGAAVLVGLAVWLRRRSTEGRPS